MIRVCAYFSVNVFIWLTVPEEWKTKEKKSNSRWKWSHYWKQVSPRDKELSDMGQSIHRVPDPPPVQGDFQQSLKSWPGSSTYNGQGWQISPCCSFLQNWFQICGRVRNLLRRFRYVPISDLTVRRSLKTAKWPGTCCLLTRVHRVVQLQFSHTCENWIMAK